MKTYYELINPSDRISFSASSDLVALLAALVVSPDFGAKRNGFQAGPYMFASSARVLQDVTNTGDPATSISEALERHREAIADALDTFQIVSIKDRAMYDEALEMVQKSDPAAAAAWRAKWLDKKRTSMSNICAYAWEMAASIRESAAEKEPEGATA